MILILILFLSLEIKPNFGLILANDNPPQQVPTQYWFEIRYLCDTH
jgi:hypothetical protein